MRQEFSELESSIPGSSSTEATAEVQGLRLVDCQSLIASVRKGTRCTDCSSPLEVREVLDLRFCSGEVTKLHCFSLFGGLGCNTISSACFVEVSMIWPFTV